jgi:hypothetical protein
MCGLQTENPLVPVWVMDETDVVDLEVSLSLFPLFRPGEVRFVELLPQFGDFSRIGRRKENFVGHRLTHHHAISFSRTIRSGGLVFGMSGLPDAVPALHSNNVDNAGFSFNQSGTRIEENHLGLVGHSKFARGVTCPGLPVLRRVLSAKYLPGRPPRLKLSKNRDDF